MPEVINADCLDHLRTMPDCSVDSLVTDPPGGISFMGRSWDSDKGGRDAWVAWMTEVMAECLRVLKPGAHGLVWALPRTSHWTATALEDAGFEIRDVITHHFGSGFPKSLDIGKAIDKAAGAEREVLETIPDRWTGSGSVLNFATDRPQSSVPITGTPATDAAKQWDGWGTALKPASEHWVLVRKPLSEKSVAANVLAHGTGGLNIDASRVQMSDADREVIDGMGGYGNEGWVDTGTPAAFNTSVRTEARAHAKGRWPANLILSHGDCNRVCEPGCPVAEMDAQSGVSSDKPHRRNAPGTEVFLHTYNGGMYADGTVKGYADSGGASRYFTTFKYTPKAPTRERPVGADGTRHETVKSLALMDWLIRLVTPPGGTVLDCFAGSGATAEAALLGGFGCVAIEAEASYIPLIEQRLARHAPTLFNESEATA
jgi:site-specific DNA-methyltransferase (adenine-specific)